MRDEAHRGPPRDALHLADGIFTPAVKVWRGHSMPGDGWEQRCESPRARNDEGRVSAYARRTLRAGDGGRGTDGVFKVLRGNRRTEVLGTREPGPDVAMQIHETGSGSPERVQLRVGPSSGHGLMTDRYQLAAGVLRRTHGRWTRCLRSTATSRTFARNAPPPSFAEKSSPISSPGPSSTRRSGHKPRRLKRHLLRRQRAAGGEQHQRASSGRPAPQCILRALLVVDFSDIVGPILVL